MRNLKTKEITLCALFASLTAILSQIGDSKNPAVVIRDKRRSENDRYI